MKIEILAQILRYSYILILSLFDICIITIIFYQAFLLINNTRAVQMFRAILFFFIITMFAGFLNLDVTEWLFKSLWTVSVIVVVVIFQPEIRSILAEIGKKRLHNIKFKLSVKEEILKAVKHFAALKIGALIVIEKNTGLREYIENGVMVNANVSNQLLITIFMPKSALHDGAVIIQNNLIASAASFLPLSDVELDMTIGTRHRAAIGLSEVSDSFIIVVSEETGDISISKDHKMKWNISYDDLEEYLNKEYDNKKKYFKRLFRKVTKPKNLRKNIDEKLIAFVMSVLVWYYVKFMIL